MGSSRTSDAAQQDAPLAWVVKAEGSVRSLKEPAMRRAVLGELLAAQTAGKLVEGLEQLQQRARSGVARSRVVLQELALERASFEAVPYMVRERAYRIAREEGKDAVAIMLLTSTMDSANPSLEEAMIGNDYASESVGERCAAARVRNRFKLDRLVHDRDHRVIRILLDNPLLVERDVVKIAAMRPTRAEVLEVIARHRRWSSQYSVRKALACNPHTPPPIARRLVPTLMRQDLRAVIQAAKVPEAIREQARALWSQPV